MKEIIAIIRSNKMKKTRDVLEVLGFPAMNARRVLGRGHQRAIIDDVNIPFPPEGIEESRGTMRYIPKRMISIMVKDRDVELVVEAIMKVNHTGNIGDGKIFVCPVDDAVRIRTGENGDVALQ
ncbi:MAG: P-II family nitrogen regulator [Methanothermobacter sp.]|nr:P-II family nitrogen regulator [Methanothermobacter sp.]